MERRWDFEIEEPGEEEGELKVSHSRGGLESSRARSSLGGLWARTLLLVWRGKRGSILFGFSSRLWRRSVVAMLKRGMHGMVARGRNFLKSWNMGSVTVESLYMARLMVLEFIWLLPNIPWKSKSLILFQFLC